MYRLWALNTTVCILLLYTVLLFNDENKGFKTCRFKLLLCSSFKINLALKVVLFCLIGTNCCSINFDLSTSCVRGIEPYKYSAAPDSACKTYSCSPFCTPVFKVPLWIIPENSYWESYMVMVVKALSQNIMRWQMGGSASPNCCCSRFGKECF